MSDGIKIASLEVQADFGSNGLRFWFIRGGLQSLATFRGEDDVIPEAAGRYPGEWIADGREVALHGFVGSDGSDADSNRAAFASAYASLLAVMQPPSLVTITVYGPNFGLGLGQSATLANVRPQRIVGPDPSDLWYEGWEGTLELVCIDSPPDWVIAGS
jgi:hypothetical protein